RQRSAMSEEVGGSARRAAPGAAAPAVAAVAATSIGSQEDVREVGRDDGIGLKEVREVEIGRPAGAVAALSARPCRIVRAVAAAANRGHVEISGDVQRAAVAQPFAGAHADRRVPAIAVAAYRAFATGGVGG